MAPQKIKKTLMLVTNQQATDQPPIEGGYVVRNWSVEIFMTNEDGELVPAKVYKEVTYHLHPSFGDDRKQQTFREPPFRLEEEGWGEFIMTINLVTRNDEIQTMTHDLHFQSERYEIPHVVEFKKIGGEMGELLKELSEKKDKKGGKEVKKKDLRRSAVDMNQLAEMLEKMPEEVLLKVVLIIQSNMTDGVYTKNDTENGEFHVDLYSLPDTAVKKIWELSVAHKG